MGIKGILTTMPMYTIDYNNLHIEDSYKVRKKEMQKKLQEIKDGYSPDPRIDYYLWANANSYVWKRSMFSLRMEWVCHNFLYSLGLWRSHTKDVDLDYPNKIEWIYNVIGCLVWVFVK